jgi:spore coat polysaccharide biosynthesis protein SpsF
MNRPHAIGIIQARFLASRLPGKIFLPLAGRFLLQVLFDRVRAARVGEWWLATSTHPTDDLTAAWGAELGLRVYRGDMDDVLSRFTAIIDIRRPQWIVRVTADDPFMHWGTLDLLLDAAERMGAFDVLAGGPGAGFPLGFTPEIARASAVLQAAHDIPEQEQFHRTHVLSWLYQIGRAARFPLPSWPNRANWRWTIDTPQDLAMAQAAFRCFGARWKILSYPEMVEILDRHPEITKMNQNVRQKATCEG